MKYADFSFQNIIRLFENLKRVYHFDSVSSAHFQSTGHFRNSPQLSGGSVSVRNAVFALISIGRDDAVDKLVHIIDEKGTVKIAGAFLNSGNHTLLEAARKWTARNGIEVEPEDSTASVRWGSMGAS